MDNKNNEFQFKDIPEDILERVRKRVLKLYPKPTHELYRDIIESRVELINGRTTVEQHNKVVDAYSEAFGGTRPEGEEGEDEG